MAITWLLTGALLYLTAATLHAQESPAKRQGGTAEDRPAADKQYIANLNAVVANDIVPGLQRGVLQKATSRPRGLTVEVTDDPSPYHIGARANADGSWTVRLSLGYVALHDAALDAAALAAALHVPEALRDYLAYQQALASQNAARRVTGTATKPAQSFAAYIGLSAEAAAALLTQREWKRERDRVEIDSLGWVVAYLLTREDPRLAGMPLKSASLDGEAAARLAAASGWRPVPPLATAVGLAGISQPPGSSLGVLCNAARLMEAGIAVAWTDAEWRLRAERDPRLRKQLIEIEAQLELMRRDGDCSTNVPVQANEMDRPAGSDASGPRSRDFNGLTVVTWRKASLFSRIDRFPCQGARSA